MEEKPLKYKTLAELCEAYDSGELNREKHIPFLDKNGLYLYELEEIDETMPTLFHIEYLYEALKQALDLCGVPYEIP